MGDKDQGQQGNSDQGEKAEAGTLAAYQAAAKEEEAWLERMQAAAKAQKEKEGEKTT